MVKLQEHRNHLHELQKQYHTQYAIGNWKKCNDLKKGIRRIQKEIRECERLMKETRNGE